MEAVVEGEIISVLDAVMSDGSKWPKKTVIYERNGQRYRGCQTHDGLYYFGGGGASAQFFADVHEAWELAYKK